MPQSKSMTTHFKLPCITCRNKREVALLHPKTQVWSRTDLLPAALREGVQGDPEHLAWLSLKGKSSMNSKVSLISAMFQLVQPAPGTGHSKMVIIQDSDQILPLCVLHLQ